jgi:transposase
MEMRRFLIETHLWTGRPIKQLAKTHGVNASWLFKLLRRYRLEADAGLEPRSRRPRRSPLRICDIYEDEIVAMRKQLLDAGFDAGAETIHFHLQERHRQVPSVSTIWRVLKARGFVTPQPHKRPKSSYVRFCADLPNECWQADVTHIELENRDVFEVLNVIDDHSRLCEASRAMVRVKATDVIRVLHKSAEIWGYPASFLSRQCSRLLRPAPIRLGRRVRAGALRSRHHRKALSSLSSTDLRAASAVWARRRPVSALKPLCWIVGP